MLSIGQQSFPSEEGWLCPEEGGGEMGGEEENDRPKGHMQPLKPLGLGLPRH